MKLKSSTDDKRIPEGFVVREHDEGTLDPAIRASGCRWVSRHENIDHPCDWYAWHRSYPAAVLAARGHATVCFQPSRRNRRSR